MSINFEQNIAPSNTDIFIYTYFEQVLPFVLPASLLVFIPIKIDQFKESNKMCVPSVHTIIAEHNVLKQCLCIFKYLQHEAMSSNDNDTKSLAV